MNISTKSIFFKTTSKRCRGYPSETQVKRGVRVVQLPYEFRQRNIRLMTLKQARTITGDVFVKPPNDKSFAAQVYESGESLPSEFDADMPVLVSEPVQWETEFRCFCLDRKVRTLSPYLRAGTHAKLDNYEASKSELQAATTFAEGVLAATHAMTPRAGVLGVGQISGRGWAIVEANGAWGSGIYGCDPEGVLDVIRHATVQPKQERA